MCQAYKAPPHADRVEIRDADSFISMLAWEGRTSRRLCGRGACIPVLRVSPPQPQWESSSTAPQGELFHSPVGELFEVSGVVAIVGRCSSSPDR
mmetsp:Transcript_19179/g.49117  ORF Transcript_19179/g.49117 Transcript_19179/m.49117 type:complete len:94 (-) Transcript_19179:396-677(-)